MRMTIAVVLALLIAAAGLAEGLGEGMDEQPVKLPAYESIPRIGWYAERGEYEAAARDSRFRLTRVSYASDDLTVFAYVYAPAEAPKTKRESPGYPVARPRVTG